MVTCWNPGQQPCWNYIDFALYAKTLKNPFQPKLSGKISEVPILSCWSKLGISPHSSFAWNRIFNWTRHHKCPVFPGEWVSQSGALKDLGNSFWVPAVKLTASLTTGVLPYHFFCLLQWGKKEKCVCHSVLSTCVSTLRGCVRAFDSPRVCLVVTPEFGVICLVCRSIHDHNHWGFLYRCHTALKSKADMYLIFWMNSMGWKLGHLRKITFWLVHLGLW